MVEPDMSAEAVLARRKARDEKVLVYLNGPAHAGPAGGQLEMASRMQAFLTDRGFKFIPEFSMVFETAEIAREAQSALDDFFAEVNS